MRHRLRYKRLIFGIFPCPMRSIYMTASGAGSRLSAHFMLLYYWTGCHDENLGDRRIFMCKAAEGEIYTASYEWTNDLS
jgi:hypothetical protein